jgi:Tfp pilus assembly protein PilV
MRTNVKSAAGFSLLEVLAALGVFAVVTLGVVPLLGSALKASSTSRSETVAKETATHLMERIQGTKWYVSYDAKPNKRVDLLDLYYPQSGSNAAMGQSFAANVANPPLVGTGGVFTTTCAPAPATANPACDFEVPDGYTVTIKASFVKKRTPATNPETYEIVTPCVTLPCQTPYTAPYAWNAQGNDIAAASLMDIDVAVGWTQHGRARSFTLRALIGERKFAAPPAVDAGPSPSASTVPVSTGVAKIHGNATIDYVMQGQTGYSVTTAQPATGCPVAPCKSEGTFLFGMSESTINTEDTGSTADQTNKVADFRIVRAYPSNQAPPPTPPPDLDVLTKSFSVKHAPPYSLTGVDQLSAGLDYIDHPDLAGADQAMTYGGENRNLKVDVANELPQAEGYFQTWGTTVGTIEGHFTNTQTDYAGRRLDDNAALGIAYFQRTGSAFPQKLGNLTKANSYALTASNRAVETHGTAGFGSLHTFRFESGSRSWTALQFSSSTATVNCKSTANPATATATASWSLNWQVNYDPTQNGGSPSTPTPVTGRISSTGSDLYNGAPVPDAIASLKALNPLQYDDSNNANDIYLFEKRDVNGNVTQKGYISDMVAVRNPPTSVSPDGRTTSAAIDGALRIDSSALNPAIHETQTSISLFKLSCEAVDNR